MVQVNEITTKSVKELAQAVNGKWESKATAKCRHTIVGHIAFVECVGTPDEYEIPVKPFTEWYKVSSGVGGWNLYQAIIQ